MPIRHPDSVLYRSLRAIGRDGLALFAAGCALAGSGHTAPRTLGYQGVLRASTGDLVNGAVDLTFVLVDTDSLGTPVWVETHPSVPVTDGTFAVTLGSNVALEDTLFTGQPLWIETQVNGTPLLPRRPLLAVLHALRAFTAEQVVEPGTNTPVLRTTETGDVEVESDGGISLRAVDPIELTSFRLPAGAAAGLVLTSDASGEGTWQPDQGRHVMAIHSRHVATTGSETIGYTRFEKIPGWTTLMISARMSSGAGNESCFIRVTVNGQATTLPGAIGPVSWAWYTSTIDITSLVDGTMYDVFVEFGSTNGTNVKELFGFLLVAS